MRTKTIIRNGLPLQVACGICGRTALPRRSALLPHLPRLAVGVGYTGLVEARCLRDLRGIQAVLGGA